MKKLFVALLFVLLIGGTTVAFSWWDSLSQEQNETLQIGEGVTLSVTAVAEAPAGKVLVPAGVTLTADMVEEVELTYNVVLDKEVVNPLTLNVVASDVLIGGVAANADLVNVNISQAAATVNNVDVLVTVSVTLDMPATETIYNEISNSPITFTLTFTGE